MFKEYDIILSKRDLSRVVKSRTSGVWEIFIHRFFFWMVYTVSSETNITITIKVTILE